MVVKVANGVTVVSDSEQANKLILNPKEEVQQLSGTIIDDKEIESCSGQV